MSNDPTKIKIQTKFRDARAGDETYICYEETTPPWDEELFFVKDGKKRNWFCHSSQIDMTKESLQKLAQKIKKDYTPTGKQSLERRLHNPLIIQVVVCRASSSDELKDLLSEAE